MPLGVRLHHIYIYIYIYIRKEFYSLENEPQRTSFCEVVEQFDTTKGDPEKVKIWFKAYP